MIRITEPPSRMQWHTNKTRRPALTPSRMNRSSDAEWSGSSMTRASSSRNAVWASSNETRCLRRLSAALRGSQSKCSSATDYIVATDRVACNSSHPVVLKGGCGAPVKVGSCIRLLACPGPPACPPMLRLACRRVSRMSSRRRRASGRCYRAPQDSVPSRAQGLPRTHPTLPPDRPSV